MSRLIASSVLCLPLTVLAAGGASPKDAIRKVLDDQVAAWNKGDLNAFMEGYWKAPELSFFSGNNKTLGWQATLDRYRSKYQGEKKEMGLLTFTELSIDLLGADHAVVKGRYNLKMKEQAPTGIFTLIFQKMPAGWRIIHDHTSSGS